MDDLFCSYLNRWSWWAAAANTDQPTRHHITSDPHSCTAFWHRIVVDTSRFSFADFITIPINREEESKIKPHSENVKRRIYQFCNWLTHTYVTTGSQKKKARSMQFPLEYQMGFIWLENWTSRIFSKIGLHSRIEEGSPIESEIFHVPPWLSLLGKIRTVRIANSSFFFRSLVRCKAMKPHWATARAKRKEAISQDKVHETKRIEVYKSMRDCVGTRMELSQKYRDNM